MLKTPNKILLLIKKMMCPFISDKMTGLYQDTFHLLVNLGGVLSYEELYYIPDSI